MQSPLQHADSGCQSYSRFSSSRLRGTPHPSQPLLGLHRPRPTARKDKNISFLHEVTRSVCVDANSPEPSPLYLPLGSEAMIWGHGGTAKNQPRDLVVWWGGIMSHSKNL